MEDQISILAQQFHRDLEKAQNSADIRDLKVKYLGKKGPIASLMMNLRDVSKEERPQFGKLVNDFKVKAQELCDQTLVTFDKVELAKIIEKERIDVTEPGRCKSLGRGHPISQMMQRVIDVLIGMGFAVQYGPDIETDYYNYEGLNFPPDHPAREMQDTFYITPEYLLRSHTSNTQLRVMESHTPPIRIIAPGTCYRNETISSRSHVFFHQVEGLYIDKNVTFADLLATMRQFWAELFQRDVKTRFRPSYFPFVEPGLEVDIECINCDMKGCSLCKKTGWLEVCGAGMVHPEVLKNGNIDPEEYSGYAWGLGIERLAMLIYGVDDIRTFFDNDIRFLSQF